MADIVSVAISERINKLFNYRIPKMISDNDTGTFMYVLPTLSFLVPIEIQSFNPTAIEEFRFVVKLTTKPLYELEVVEGTAIKILENNSVLPLEYAKANTVQEAVTVPLTSDLKVAAYYLS